MEDIKKVLTLIRNYCNSFSSRECMKNECVFGGEGINCGLEDAPEWTDKEIEKHSKALAEFENKKK